MNTKSALKRAAVNGVSAVMGVGVVVIVIAIVNRDDSVYAPSFLESVGVGGSVFLAFALFVLAATASFIRSMTGGSDGWLDSDGGGDSGGDGGGDGGGGGSD